MARNDTPDHIKAWEWLDQAYDTMLDLDAAGNDSTNFSLRCANTHALASIAQSLYRLAEKHGESE